MADVINGVKVPFVPIIPGQGSVHKNTQLKSKSFNEIFSAEIEKVKFSNHASKRLEARNIQLTENDLSKLQEAVSKAESKGAKDSLVMMNDTAFIINIPNKTVVTAMDIKNSSENVFTNIDSVVFAE